MRFGNQTVTLRSADGDSVWGGVLMRPLVGSEISERILTAPYIGSEIASLAAELTNFSVEVWRATGPATEAALATTCADEIAAAGLTYPIQTVEPMPDRSGATHHVKITCVAQVDPAQLLADLLAVRGQQITLTPATGVATEKPSGGFDYGDAAARAAQTLLLYKTTGFDGIEQAQTDQGVTRKLQYQLYGAAGAQIALGDAWSDAVADYEVHSVDRSRPYCVMATVVGFLKTTGHGYGA